MDAIQVYPSLTVTDGAAPYPWTVGAPQGSQGVGGANPSSGAVPDPSDGDLPGLTEQSIWDGLARMGGGSAQDDADIASFLQEQFSEDSFTEQTNTIQVNQAEVQQAIKAQQAALAAAEQKLQQAEQEQQNEAQLDKITAGFQLAASVASIVIGGLMCLTGVGAAPGALLIAGGVVGVIGGANSEEEAIDGYGVAGSYALAHGETEAQARQADENFSIAVSVIAGVLAISAVAGGFSGVLALAEDAGTLGSALLGVAGAVQGVNGVATGVTDGVKATDNYNMTLDQSDADVDQAEADREQAQQTDINQQIAILIEQLQQSLRSYAEFLAIAMTMEKDRSRSVEHAASAV